MKKILTSLVLASLFSARSLTRADEVTEPITFTKITEGDIVNDLGHWVGCAWGDFNNDGFLDLSVANYGGANVLYRNNGNGKFTKITQGDPVQDIDTHVEPIWGDYDNDGNLDLLVSAGGTASRNLLYHNNGDGTFTPVSGGSVTNQLGFFIGGIWADFDNDGFLDLFITNNGNNQGAGGKNLLFHNNGAGVFARVTSGVVASDVGFGWGALWADYDNDGFTDLLVINNNNDNLHNSLYHNKGDGTFTRVLNNNSIVTDLWPQGADSGAWGDYDNDGLPDLFIATHDAGTSNALYHNKGGGVFSKITSGAVLSRPSGSRSIGCVWGDYDNDGYLDLFVANDTGTSRLFHNNGDGTFTQTASGDPVNHGGHTASWVDYDNDGFLDLFVTGQGNDDGSPNPNLLYHNGGNTNAWLEIKCVGTVANRSAIGAKVRVHATIGGKPFWQMREINNGCGRGAQTLVAHFGLGDATNVEVLRIEWPSGTVQEFQGVTAKQILTITEPPRLLATATNGIPQFSLKGGRGFEYQIDVSTDLKRWLPVGTATITNLTGTAQIPVGLSLDRSFYSFYRAVYRPTQLDENFHPQLPSIAKACDVSARYSPEISVQSDGRIIVYLLNPCFGDTYVRLNRNGSLDATFVPGNSGLGITNFTVPPGLWLSSGDEANPLVPLASGQYLIINPYVDSPTDWGGLARLNSDGSFDSTFHSAIRRNYPVGYVAVQPDGKILVTSQGDISPPVPNLVRLNQDGTLDTNFQFRPAADQCAQVPYVQNFAVLLDGKLMALEASYLESEIGPRCVQLLRYNPDGSWDPTFQSPVNGANVLFEPQMLVDSRGRLILFLFNYASGAGVYRMVRLNQDGTLDESFGVDFAGTGAVDPITGTGNRLDPAPVAVALEADGNLIVAGRFDLVNGLPQAPIVRVLSDLPGVLTNSSTHTRTQIETRL